MQSYDVSLVMLYEAYRLSSVVRAGTTGVTLSLETEDQKHMDELIQHLKEKNIDFKVLT